MSNGEPLSRAQRTRTNDGAGDIYDHEISLVDTTVPQDAVGAERTRSASPAAPAISRKHTGDSIRERLIRRKYARWQRDRFTTEDSRETPSNGVVDQEPSVGNASETETTDFARESTEGNRKGKQKVKTRRKEEAHYEIEILYENQRGWFLFGIPLYSHSSLLNLDPGPWITKDLKDTAVDITNAQVPDPSWIWAWKRWYVDMSYDVDEEGWQYSFSFGQKWVWHGSHPWFHSFVRRRRWLRKRVKRDAGRKQENLGDALGAAHQMTGDYFTIHSKRDHSPASAMLDASTGQPISYASARSEPEADLPPEDIKDIPNLLKALRLAKIDREKIDAVKRFVVQGGDEIAYLPTHIREIMSLLVFQSSQAQLIAMLRDESSRRLEGPPSTAGTNGEPLPEPTNTGAEHLQTTIKAAENAMSGLEYLKDKRDVLNIDGNESPDEAPDFEHNPTGKIRGIPTSAELGLDPTERFIKNAQGDKGKGKEKERL